MTESVDFDYLQRCLALHGELTKSHYKRRQDLASVEKAAESIRSSRTFKYEDIEAIKNSEFWDGSKFWHWPSKADIESKLNEEGWDFWNIPKNEVPLLERLVALFRFIEPVSVILRFVAPKDYGIFSAPVAKVLEVRHGASLVETYRNYLVDLRQLRDKRGFKSAAEVDMALWVLQFGVREGRLKGPEREELLKAFEADSNLRGMCVRNLSKRLLEFTPVQRADGLLPVDLAQAAEIAGIEFEKKVRKRAKKLMVSSPGLFVVINELHNAGVIDSSTRSRWHQARDTRNKAMHGKGRLAERSVRDLINEIKRMESEEST